MEMPAKRRMTYLPSLQYGVVREDGRTGLVVITEVGDLDADIAVSCLVMPEPGDTVLLSTDETGCSYILSILERPEKRTTRLAFGGDVEIQVRKGGMTVTTEEAISFAARDFELNAHAGKVHIDSLSFAGRMIESQVAKIKVIAETLDSIIRRAVQRLRSSYRYVEEHEEVQSASSRMLVDGTFTIQTKNTMHTAEGHIKIDAEQIHLG